MRENGSLNNTISFHLRIHPLKIKTIFNGNKTRISGGIERGTCIVKSINPRFNVARGEDAKSWAMMKIV